MLIMSLGTLTYIAAVLTGLIFTWSHLTNFYSSKKSKLTHFYILKTQKVLTYSLFQMQFAQKSKKVK
jgi:hypothetical protein